MSVKIITSIYSDLNGSEFGGRPNRGGHYRWSLLSLLKMSEADFVCYTSEREFDDLENFFYDQYKIDKNKLKLIVFDLNNHHFLDLFKKYKNFEQAKAGDRCIEIQYMKFIWFNNEDMSYDHYFWFDAGLSHCGLIPNKYLAENGIHNSQFYSSELFNNNFLSNLIKNTEDKFTIVGKENDRNYWSGTVNIKHFINGYDRSRHVIGGFFGGKKELWIQIVKLFEKYAYQVTEDDKYLYHEEDIMTLMFRNHPELFHDYEFDTWWHENERISGLDMNEHLKINKSFYKILEELNEYE
jgi:hypothetical protein